MDKRVKDGVHEYLAILTTSSVSEDSRAKSDSSRLTSGFLPSF